MHVKLFKVIDKEIGSAELEQLYPQSLWLNDQIVGVPYENRRDSYRELIESIQNIEVKQLIITGETFLNLIMSSVAKGYDLIEMDFIESVPKENQEIVSYYKKQLAEEKNLIKRKLLIQNFFSELDWIIRDESVDIKKISIRLKNKNNQREGGATLYANGIFIVESEEASPSLMDLLKEIE